MIVVCVALKEGERQFGGESTETRRKGRKKSAARYDYDSIDIHDGS